MKKIILLFLLAPLMSFAQEDLSDLTLDEQQPEAYRCARNSDIYCYGKPVGVVCIRDPQPPYGSGLCRQRSKPDNNGDVTCVCR